MRWCYPSDVGSGSDGAGRGESDRASGGGKTPVPASHPGDGADTVADPPVRDRAERRPVATMRDIAAAAEVSQSTVSRVLSGVPTAVPIAPETRERVVQAARRLGYRPNPLARGLRGASTNLLGAVVRDFSDPFFAGAIEALVNECTAHGYNVVLGHARSVTTDRSRSPPSWRPGTPTRSSCSATCRNIRKCWRPRGHVRTRGRALAGHEPAGVPHRRRGRPGRDLGRPGPPRVARAPADRVGDTELPGDYRVREDAYLDFMRERFGGAPPDYLARCGNTLAGGDAALRRLWELPERPTAVATSTDLVAVGVLHAAHSLGAIVPDRLSVVGFDDILIAAHTVPALTPLRMPINEIVGPRGGAGGRAGPRRG